MSDRSEVASVLRTGCAAQATRTVCLALDAVCYSNKQPAGSPGLFFFMIISSFWKYWQVHLAHEWNVEVTERTAFCAQPKCSG